ncbi:hypothetical protein PTTG_31010, partial [Puccinia triticina 1-1 BBBD Race 1]
MTSYDTTNIKLVTEKLDRDNFTSWRWNIATTLGYKMLDNYILDDHTEDMKKSSDYQTCCKMTTNFIRMHMSTANLE